MPFCKQGQGDKAAGRGWAARLVRAGRPGAEVWEMGGLRGWLWPISGAFGTGWRVLRGDAAPGM